MMAFRLTFSFPSPNNFLPKQSVKLLLSVYSRLISNVKASRAPSRSFSPLLSAAADFLLDKVTV